MAESEKKKGKKPASQQKNAQPSAVADDAGQSDSYVIAPFDWYILKVQVNREKTIKKRLEDAVERSHDPDLRPFFKAILVPEEKVSVVKNGKKREVGRLRYPGYLIVNMEVNRDTWFKLREIDGIGDFTGAEDFTSGDLRIRKPVPMLPHEVQRIQQLEQSSTDNAAKVQIPFKIGDRVKIKEGSFDGIEGEVTKVDDITGRVTVIITIFGRSTPVDLEYWQAEQIG